MADLSRSIRMSVESGKVLFGSRQAVAAALNGTAKVIVISASAPKTVASDIRQYAKLSNVPIVDFPGPSRELGAVCGVPYIVSAITVMSVGNSDLLSVAKTSTAHTHSANQNTTQVSSSSTAPADTSPKTDPQQEAKVPKRKHKPAKTEKKDEEKASVEEQAS